MYKNKIDGRNNICGIAIGRLRKETEPYLSQRQLAASLQLKGLDLDKNAIQRMESGQRFITDIELQKIAEYFGVTVDELYEIGK